MAKELETPIEENEEQEPEQQPESLEQAAIAALEKKEAEAKAPDVDPKLPSKDEPKKEDGKEKDDGEGYYADENDEEGPEEEVPAAVQDQWKNLSPLERYLAENIQPLVFKGVVDGKTTTIQAYSVENIPENFEFATRSAERLALAQLGRIERTAEQLRVKFDNEQSQEQSSKFTVQENADIRSDIAQLQRDGEIPLGTKNVNPDDDPKLQIARDVLEYYHEENDKRLDIANRSGRLFHRLSYYDAFRLWKIDNAKVGKEQAAEDKERQDITRRAARGQRQGATQHESKRVNLPRTASLEEVAFAALGR